MALPTFFLIGAIKAGTTSLHLYLGEHPEIHMSPVKEPHFFARPDDGGIPHRIGDRGSYERLFESPLRVRGESSPTYSMHPRHRDVPKRIAELIPDAKFLYLVRDPVERIISHYLHNVATGLSRTDFQTAVGDLADRNNPFIYPTLYAMQLEQYLKYFPLESFLVLDHAELASNRGACLRRTFEFLGVQGDFKCEAFREKHGAAATRRQYPRGYERFVNRLGSSHLRVLPKPIRRSSRRIVERALWRPLPQANVSPAARREIQQVCAPDVARLRSYTGLALATWQTSAT